MSGNIPIIKEAVKEDAVLMAELSSGTFYESFAKQNTKEDMEKYLSEKFNLEVIKEELSDTKTIFFIIYLEGEAAGYTKLRQNKTPPQLENKRALEIERIYVYKKHHHKKLGAALMKRNIEYALKNGFNMLWLGVWEHNLTSIEFYKRWGFEVFGKHIFRLGNDDQNDLLMKKPLHLDHGKS